MDTNLSGKILGINDQVSGFWLNLKSTDHNFAVVDILFVAVIIYYGYILFKETRAIRIIYGILFLAIVMLIGQILQLTALNFVLRYLVTMILVAIPIVFQPELRAALERLGRAKIVTDFANLKRSEISMVVETIVKVSKTLANNKIGALMVITQKTGLRDIIEKGVRLDAEVSAELLISIFTPNTPLHDGAVIISGNKIMSAKCTLPLSDDEFDFSIGTRHRAAIGLSSQSDAIVIVVSEERGTISLAYNGQLSRAISPKELEDFILAIIQQKSNQKNDQKFKVNKISKE